jgi:mucin-19
MLIPTFLKPSASRRRSWTHDLLTATRWLLTGLALVCLGLGGESAAHTINSKTNSTPDLTVGGIATYSITVSSAGQSSASTGMTTVDTLPPGFAYRSTQSITLVNGAFNGGTVVPTPGSTTPQWGLFSNPNNSSTPGSPSSYYTITFDADVINPTCGANVTNTADTLGGTQHAVLIPATNTAPLNITGPTPAMVVTKTTSTPVVINSGSGMQALYTIVVSNATGKCAATGVNIADVLPAGFTYASTGAIAFTGSPAAASRPSGSNPAAGATNPVWSGFVIPAGTSVSLSFTANIANATLNGIYNNSASATAAESGTTVANFGPGAPVQLASARLTKAFTPALIPVGGTSNLTFTITKPAGAAASGFNFTEALPANVTVSGTPVALQCGGTVSSTATSITVTGASIAAASTSCTISANVTSNVSGVYTNDSSNISGLAGGLIATALNATLTVSNSVLTKAFLTPVIGAGGSSVMRFTLTNSTGAANTGLAFTETLPANVTVVPGFTVSQCGGSVSSGGPQNLTLAGASLAAGASCNIDVTVTSNVPGAYVNGAGQISGLAGGVTANGVNATLTVRSTILEKSFNPGNIGVGGTSLLTFTISNTAGSPAQPGLGFTETLPANVSRLAGFTTSQCGGTVSSSGPQNITFTGGTLTLGASQCTINVNVTSSVIGTYVNGSAQISGPSAGMDISGVNASLTVGNVVLTKGFSDSPVNVNTVIALTFTLTNSPGNPAQSAIAFTDTFPAGLILANNTGTFGAGCAGTLTNSSGGALALGGLGARLAGGTMAAGTASCNITFNVTSATPGTYINDSSRITGASLGLGTGGVNATAQFNGAKLLVSKVTSTPAVDIVGAASGLATYTITVANSGNATAIGVAITDTLPLGFTYAATGAITLNGGATRPSITNPVAGAPVPAWSSFTLPGGSNVVLTFDATIPNATASGSYNNSASVTTTTANTSITNYDGNLAGNTADDVAVRRLADLTITKAQVTPNPVSRGQTGVQFTLTVNNIGAAPKASPNLVTVTETAPAGMTITTMSGTGWTCSVPTCTRTDVLANGASYPPITLTVSIDANAALSLTNSSTVALDGQVESNTNNNTGNAPATQVNPNVALTKASSPNLIGVNSPSTLTFTLSNGSGNPPQTGLAFTDTLPANVVVASPPGVVSSCGGTTTAVAGGSVITLGGGSLTAGSPSCTVSVKITSAVPGVYANTAANISALGGGLAASGVNDTLTVRGTSLAKAFSPTSVDIAQISTLTFTLTNALGNPAQSGLAFIDTFPAGLVVATPNGLASSCGGAVTATPGSGSFSLSGGSMALATPTCTVAVNVLSNTANVYVNNASNVSGASAGMTTSGVNATLTVASPDLSLIKTHSGNFTVGVQGSYVLTVNNTLGSVPTSGTITVVDTLPTGLVYVSAGSGGTGWACAAAGQVVTCTSSTVIAAGAASASPININVSVAAVAVPIVTNSATVRGGGEPAVNAGNNTAFDPTIVVVAATNTLQPDGVQTALPGTTVFYPHTFNISLTGTVVFSTSNVPTPAAGGWSNVIYRDSNCNGVLDGVEGTAPQASSISVNPGNTVCIVIKEFVPASAPYNANDLITVTATFTPLSGPVVIYTRTDTTTVGNPGGAGLSLTKTVRNVTTSGSAGTANAAKPGETLEYTVAYSNTSADPLATIMIHDATPAFTAFVSANCGAPLPANVTACNVTTQPAGGASGGISWTLTGTLAPTQTGTVLFRVILQ